MSLSIVITTFNRAAVLRNMLEGLVRQTDGDFQVVVAIDGSTDGTEAMLNSLRVPYALTWVNTHYRGYGLALARNLGILAADGRAVAILDDDSVPVAGFVAAHKASVAQGVITGAPRDPAGDDERLRWKMRELGRLPPLTPMTIPELRRDWPNAYLVENNICMLREDFVRIGLFSEQLRMYGFIGQEFFGRAEHFGWRYQFNPSAGVVHHGEIAGDNGFAHARKVRQTRWATLLRPTLMTPHHYRAQADWARARAEGRDHAMPPHRMAMAMAMALPWRAFRMALAGARRGLRNRGG